MTPNCPWMWFCTESTSIFIARNGERSMRILGFSHSFFSNSNSIFLLFFVVIFDWVDSLEYLIILDSWEVCLFCVCIYIFMCIRNAL